MLIPVGFVALLFAIKLANRYGSPIPLIAFGLALLTFFGAGFFVAVCVFWIVFLLPVVLVRKA